MRARTLVKAKNARASSGARDNCGDDDAPVRYGIDAARGATRGPRLVRLGAEPTALPTSGGRAAGGERRDGASAHRHRTPRRASPRRVAIAAGRGLWPTQGTSGAACGATR